MILIMEGCDCSGKDTLAEAIAERTNYEIVRGSSFELAKEGTDVMYKYMSDLLDRNNIIINRFFMSNYVYGKLFNYPTMSDKQFVDLAKKTNDKALTIYLTANSTTIKSRLMSRGDDMVKMDRVDSILKKYNEVINDGLTAQKLTMQINTSYSNNTNFTASMIAEFVKMEESLMFIKNN